MFKYDDNTPRKAYSIYMSTDLHEKLKRLSDAKGHGLGRNIEMLVDSMETTSLIAVTRIVQAREQLRESLNQLDRLDVSELDAGDQYRKPDDLGEMPALALLSRFTDPDAPPYSPWVVDAAIELAHRYAADHASEMAVVRAHHADAAVDEVQPLDNAGTTRADYCSECDASPDDGLCAGDGDPCELGLPTVNDFDLDDFELDEDDLL